MTGRIKDLSISLSGKQVLSVELDEDFREGYDKLKEKILDVDLKVHREKRSLSANAYFHLLLNKIARVLQISDTECKKRLVCDYGALLKNDGETVGFKLPAEVNPDMLYPYTRLFDERTEGGKAFKCYVAYKHTSDMNTAEMASLIDGTVFEAKCLGIETDTPEEIMRLKSLWAEGDNNG